MARSKLNTSQLDIISGVSYVVTDQSTTSTTYAGLATAQAVTVVTGTRALVLFTLGSYNVAVSKRASVAVSGATTVAASDDWSTRNDSASAFQQHQHKMFTGLTPGSNTFTLVFKTASGTANFFERTITAVAL